MDSTYLSKQPSGARALGGDRCSAVCGFVCAAAGRAPHSPPLVRSNVPSWPAARGADLHGLVRRRAFAPPPRCSSATTDPHGHPHRATIPAAVLLSRRSPLPPPRRPRSRSRWRAYVPPSVPHVRSVTSARPSARGDDLRGRPSAASAAAGLRSRAFPSLPPTF